jgi:hypothetical protein
MEWTERDKMEYGNFQYIRLFSDGNNDLKIVAEVGLETVQVTTEGTYLSISMDGDRTRYYARSIEGKNGEKPFTLHKEVLEQELL